MARIPKRAILVRRDALKRLNKTSSELSQLLAFEVPFDETNEVLVYGPYFDFESLAEIGRRLQDSGFEFWDDYFELKEDIPEWITLEVVDES